MEYTTLQHITGIQELNQQRFRPPSLFSKYELTITFAQQVWICYSLQIKQLSIIPLKIDNECVLRQNLAIELTAL